MSAVLKLGPTIAQDKVRRTDTSRVGDFRGVVCFLRPQTNQGSLRVIMFKAKSLRSLLINIFASAGLFAAASGLAMAQQVALSLASGSAIPGRSVSLNLSLTTSGGAQPTALQWIIAYPASAISSVSVTPGTAATAASKNVTCSSRAGSTICVVFGAHDNALSNGVLATATLNIAAGTIVTSAPVQVASVTAITAADLSIPTSATGRVIAIRPASGTAINGSAATTSQESSAI
jgi:hypothetical protein